MQDPRKHRVALAGEAGFGLIEAVVSAALLLVVFVGIFGTLYSGLTSVERTREYQQATALGNEAIELARDLEFDQIVMDQSSPPFAADPRITSPGSPQFDPDGPGPLLIEDLVVAPAGGAIAPHQEVRTVGHTDFTMSRYVSWVDDDSQGGPDRDYKRYVVIVEWGNGLDYQASTFVTETRRGLPLPKFELFPETVEIVVAPGNQAVLTHGIKNVGILDAYDLTITIPGDLINLGPPQFYLDADNNLEFDPAVDPLLLDTNANGVPDTGNVDTDDSIFFHAVWPIDPLEPNRVDPVQITATSGANDTVFEEVTDTLRVGPAGTLLYLHHDPTPPVANTVAKRNLTMNKDIPTATTLYNYSTDLDSDPGREVDKGGSVTSSDATKSINWLYQAPDTLQLDGTGEVTLWVAPDDFDCGKTVNLNIALRQKNSANPTSGTLLASTSYLYVPPAAGCGYERIQIPLPVTATVPQNKWLELKIYLAASADDGMLAYDTTTFTSSIVIPTVTTS